MTKTRNSDSLAFLFDLDGTLVDSVYQHVLAWREATQAAGIELPVWRIHRQIGMSGGLMLNALARETGRQVSRKDAERIQLVHAEAFANQVPSLRVLPGAQATAGYIGGTSGAPCHCDERTKAHRTACAQAAHAPSERAGHHARRRPFREARSRSVCRRRETAESSA